MRLLTLSGAAALSLLMGLTTAAPVLHAADLPSPKTSPGKPAITEGKRELGKPVKRMEEDPLNRVRERLSEKLGAQPHDVGGDVKVTTRSKAALEGAAVKSTAGGVRAERLPNTWAYSGPGRPEQWAQLRPEYARCATGKRQSPIDIRDGIAVNLDPIEFDYKSSVFGVMDTGRTVQVNVAPGNFIEVMGRRYQLQRFDFQHPAEERINGRSFAMGAHLVHKDEQGRLAVVAVLFERGGAEQPVVQQVLNNLPLERGDEITSQAGLDATSLLPSDRRYYTYMGSLTTPPCQEGVLWLVMKEPVVIAADQLAILARLYPMNARPTQPISGRLIKGPR
jgi:carbonic anhydrase